MQIYRHRQVGTLALVVLVPVAGLLVALLANFSDGPVSRLTSVVLAILVAIIVLFWSLTVDVTSGRVAVWFGPGIIRKRIPVTDIQGVTAVRNPWFYGWGIRLIPRGWMYNISGLDAVELTLPDDRVFRIGTNDPDALVSAIRLAIQYRG